MSLADLASIATVISGAAILVSLVYLSLQTRQNTKHTRALIQQGRAGWAPELLLPLTSNQQLAETYVQITSGDLSIDAPQIVQYCFWLFTHFYLWEDQFYQHREGMIDDGYHEGLSLAIRARFQSPETRATWKMVRGQFAPEFRAFLDGLMNAARAAPEVSFEAGIADTWKSLVATERSRASG
jgi:hypothetical protein